jgi:hypothetical protein
MGSGELVERAVASYNSQIKGYLAKGSFFMAGMELENIRDSLADGREAILHQVHMGAGFLASLDGLITLCSSDNPDLGTIRAAQGVFEMYAAQTRLPKGN